MNNETNSSLFRFKSRVASLFMSAALLATTFTGLGGTLVSAASDEASAPVYAAAAPAASSNLPDSIYDGNILHCFNWTLGTIKENLPQIAEAGFTSIQTSPLQPHDAQGPWYWIYQPLGFSIGNELGDENDLKSLCEAAHGYGIKVIVDVVANHLAGSKSGEWKGYIQSDLNNSQYFHNQGAASNWDDRNEIIYKNIGMPDLNTENSYVIDVIKGYVNKLKSCGVDGIRWDAAKHIGLPSEGSNFWSTMSGLGMYMYGEILDGPAGSERDNQGNIIQSRYDYNSSLAAEYGKYIGVTDGNYSGEITGSIRDGRVSESNGKWIKRGVAAEHVVYWAESHDTYSNDDGGWTKNLSESVMDRAYAVLGARAKSQSLYLSRPNAKSSDDIYIGSKGNDHYQSAQVAEVNKFHNANVGTQENFGVAENCYVVCRGKGAVVVNASGGGKQVTVPNGGGLVPAGTYTDKVGGGTWTVTSDKMTGTIGDTGIAVFYNGENVSGSVSVSPSTGSIETTLTVTLNAKDATDLTYTTSEGDSGSYTNGKTITIGAKTAVGGTVTVTVSGKNTKGETVTAKGTYTKIDPNAKVTVNVDNSVGNWTKVYAYVYKGSGGQGNEMATWPGVEMTPTGNNKYTLDVTGYEQGRAIFSDGNNDASKRYPADGAAGLEIGGKSKIFTMPNKWEDYSSPVPSKLSVSLSASPATVKVGDKVTLTATPSNATGTVTYSFKAGSTALTASGATATWTADAEGTKTFTVTATDSSSSATATASVTVEKGGDDDTPTVTASKASGTSFTDETLDVTLTLKNADKGYYQIDGGSKKLINGSTTIKVGEGKIGDTTVTVKAVAIGSDKTEKTYTFTYEKKYVAKSTSSSASTLSSYYKTNPNGQTGGSGVTITSAADFKENMIIAQGVANDDPRIFRGSHEGPVYDTYALYAAWDSTNLYLGWQFVNVTDVSDPLQGYPISDNGKPYILSIPQMILIDTGKGTKGDTSKKSLDTGKFVWNIAVGSKSMFDTMICFSSQPGVGEPSLFKATSSGLFSYTDGAVPFKEGGISFKYEDGFFGSKIYGIKASGYETSELLSDSSNWIDFLTEGHDKTKDTFYVMTIPLATLGIDKAYLESTGIGVMHVSTFGASGLQSCPMDYDAFLDNAKTPYSADDSTSGEKEDIDVVTVSLARVGAGGDNPPPPPPETLTVNFGTDKAAPQLPTTKLTLKGIAAGGTSPYKYAFYVDGTQVQAASSTATYSWTPGSEKSYTIKCVVTDSAGNSATVSKTFTAAEDDDLGDDPTPVLTNKSSVSATSVKVGSSVTLTGSASGGKTPYQFSYAYKLSSASSYTSIKAYSTAATAQFAPSAAGTYTVKISVKDAASTVKDKTFTVTTSDNPTTLTNKSYISSTTVKLGGTITVNCAASGGTTPYKYAVFYKKSSSTSYTTAQSYSTTKTVSIKPGAATVYNVRVKVKDAKDTVKTLDFDFAVTNPDTNELKNTSKLSASSIEKGSSVTITGSATGGKTSYQYSAYYKKGSDSFTKIRDYSKTATMTFKPASTGTYTIRVKVKDAAGKVVNKDLTLKVTAALSNTSKISATSVTLGKSVTITGAATGGTSPYKYAAYYKKASSTEYTKIRDYSTTATMTFKPAAAVKYNVRVKVKDSKNTVKNKDFTITVTNAELANTSKVSATSVTLGKSVTITGAATGGTTPYKYAAWYKKASASDYTKLRDYSTTATMTFKPASAVKYSVRVKVKDAKNVVRVKDFTITVTNAGLSNTSKISATSVKLGTTITLTGAATGGTTPYQYSAYYKKTSSTEYTKICAYSTTTKMTFKPGTATTYNVKVKVKDKTGTIVSKDFKVTVTK